MNNFQDKLKIASLDMKFDLLGVYSIILLTNNGKLFIIPVEVNNGVEGFMHQLTYEANSTCSFCCYLLNLEERRR